MSEDSFEYVADRLDSASEPTKHQASEEYFMRRDLCASAQDSDESDSCPGALLLLRFVRSVQRGYVPEPHVIARVGSAFEQVLKECTHHLDSELLADLNAGRASSDDYRYKGKRLLPTHFWAAEPDTPNRQTGDSFVKAFDMHRKGSTKDPVAYSSFSDTDERLAKMVRASPSEAMENHFLSVVLEDYEIEVRELSEGKYSELWNARFQEFEKCTEKILDSDEFTDAMQQFNKKLEVEAKEYAFGKLAEPTGEDARRLRSKYRDYAAKLPSENHPTLLELALEETRHE